MKYYQEKRFYEILFNTGHTLRKTCFYHKKISANKTSKFNTGKNQRCADGGVTGALYLDVQTIGGVIILNVQTMGE